jgi:uncharacterized protein YbaP (TraB family)
MKPNRTMEPGLGRGCSTVAVVVGAARAVTVVAALSFAFATTPSTALQARQPAPSAAPQAQPPAPPGKATQQQPTTEDTQPQSSPSEPIDEVVVSGEQPGPGLWKVSKGDHVLWILGTLSPLPKRMMWRSGGVEKIIAQSQEIIGQEQVSANVGFFREITLIPSLLHARLNPDGATLKEILPAPLYARWLKLKLAYIGNDSGIEKWRPMFAAIRLYQRAIDHSDLTQSNIVRPVVEKVAREHDVKITKLKIKVDVGNPRQTIKDFAQTPRSQDIACLAATIERLETDLDNMKLRANAWAVGDLDTLERLPAPDQVEKCVEAFTSGPGLQEKLNAGQKLFYGEWLAAADRALANNRVAFAMLPMSELLGANGRLAKLKARGYSVEPPQ